MNIYGIYDIKEKEQCIRIGTIDEIARFLSLTGREINSALKRNNLIKKQYKLCYLFKE